MGSITKKPFDLIIFDQDGTLVDSRLDITNSVNHALGVLGLPLLDITTITGYVGEGVTKLIESALGARKELLEDARSLFLEYYRSHLTDNTYLYPNVIDILEYFKVKRKAVISNKLESLTRDLLRDIGILHYFDIVLGGDSVNKKKPFPDPIIKVIESLNVEKGMSLMIGDSPTDIEAGKSAGVFTCAVTYGYREREVILKAMPDYIIDSLIGLKEIIA